jgi:hypothetical protein
MLCSPGLVFGGAEGVGSFFHVLHSRSRFRRYHGRRVPISYFALPDTFSAVSRASGPVFMFCASGLVFGGSEGVRSRFHVLRIRTRFRRFRGRRVLFHVLRSRTCFRRFRGRRVPFSCCALLDSFLAVRRKSAPVFMFCAPRHIFDGTLGIGSRFHVLRARTRFLRYRGRRVTFSSFATPNSFSSVPRASGPVFMICVPVLVFGDTEGVGSRFHVVRSRTRFWRCGGRMLLFLCFALPDSFCRRYRGRRLPFSVVLVFGCTDGVGCRFQVLRSGTHFGRCGGRRVPLSYFALPNTYSAVPRASGLIFMLCAPGIIFGGSECVKSCFHVLRPRTRFWRYRGRRVPFSCFALLDSFSAVPRASGPIFMFCTP